jgi:FlgD Ig-like domain
MRKSVTTLLASALLVACASMAGAADRYPPGPGGACPDTITLFKFQNPAAAPCHPAALDTVWGLRGVIIGFDARASAFGFYIQHRGLANWAGVDVFTAATNYMGPVPGSPSGGNLQLGDSVAVYGTKQEFQGETEIEGPDVTQSTDDIIIRKINSGNALPAPIAGTTATFSHLPTNPLAEQYEGMLVGVTAPMRVARTSLTGGLPFNSFLLVNQTGPATDSVHVDGQTLTAVSVTPPAVGTLVSSVRGIWHQRTNTVSSFRIQLRDGNDIAVATPPNLADAYPLADNVVRVVFDRNITLASAENEANYSLASLGSVDNATAVSGSAVNLTITNGLADGDVEGVTVVGVVAAASGLAMTTPQSLGFVNGVVEPSVVQAADPSALGGSPCEDRSRYAGPGTSFGSLRVSVRGISVAQYGSLYYMVGQSGGVRNGVSVFGPPAPLTRGNRYLVVGFVQEFGTGPQNGRETEIVSSPLVIDEGPAAELPPLVNTVSAFEDTLCDATGLVTTGEDYECTLVRVNRAKITENRLAGQSFFITDEFGVSGDTILVSNNSSSYTFEPDSLQIIQVTGTLSSNSQSSRRFRIQPRTNADIRKITGTDVEPINRTIAFASSPNPARVPRMVFTLPAESDVELAVYDLFGRRVQTLAKGKLEAGTHTREWNGLGETGGIVGSGIYFYKLSVGKEYVKTIQGVKLN